MKFRGGGAPENNAPARFLKLLFKEKLKFIKHIVNCDICDLLKKNWLKIQVKILQSADIIYSIRNKYAFTMAEVLITIGIIGVVAAMTFPSLVAGYRKNVALNKLKKAYTEISQAFQMAELEHGPCEYWDYGTAFDGDSAVNFMNTYLVPYLKVIKNCGKESGCWNGEAYSLSGIRNSVYGDSSTHNAKIIVNSGYSIGITSGGYYVNVQISLNGPSGDEKAIMGKDLFFGSLSSKGTPVCKFNAHGQGETRSGLTNGDFACTTNAGDGAGMSCLGLIIHDGWLIRKDYPVKF